MKRKKTETTPIYKILSRILALCLAAVFLAGCDAGELDISDEEVRTALGQLLPAAAELNEIYYGNGLKTLPGEEGATFLQIAEDAAYHSIAELEDATMRVFSEDLGSQMVQIGTQGIFEEDNERMDLESRYTEFLGFLVMRASMSKPVIELGRTYDISTAVIERARKNYVEVRIISEKDGEPLELTLRLVPAPEGDSDETEDGEWTTWRLDTPTY